MRVVPPWTLELVTLMFIGQPYVVYKTDISLIFRVLEFAQIFDKLPQFNPETSEVGTPLPQSPRGIIVSYKKRRKIYSQGMGEYL